MITEITFWRKDNGKQYADVKSTAADGLAYACLNSVRVAGGRLHRAIRSTQRRAAKQSVVEREARKGILTEYGDVRIAGPVTDGRRRPLTTHEPEILDLP